MISIRYAQTPKAVISADIDTLQKVVNEQNETLWIDIHSNDDILIKSALEAVQCHPLAIIDALRLRHPPKVEYFENRLLVLYRGIRSNPENLVFEHQQIAFFVGKNYLISVHRGPSLGIDEALKSEELQSLIQKPISLCCKVMHLSSAIYQESVLNFEAELSDMEDSLLNSGSDKTLAELTACQSRLLKLIRTFNYHKNLSVTLLRMEKSSDNLFQESDSHHAIQDLNDRFDRVLTLAQMHYGICGDLINGYISISSHQLNNTMRVLTVITAIFVPLGFLAGLYGMNFDYIPELKLKHGYFILLTVMAIIAASSLYFFRKKRWL